MKKKEFLAIFDLDGTLFDTGEVNYCAYRDALLPYNVTLDKEYFVSKCNGRHYTEFLPEIIGSNQWIESIHKAKKAAYVNNLDKAIPNIHLLNMIYAIKEKYYIAVVTTASRQNTMDILRYFRCDGIFDLIITHEDITHLKPEPEGFLKAMSYFGIDPKHTVVFEDSEVGLFAARATGGSVLVVDRV